MKRLELVKKLEQSGCVLLRHSGKHDIYHNPQTGRSEPVPRHREINEMLARTSGAWRRMKTADPGEQQHADRSEPFCLVSFVSQWRLAPGR